MNTQIVCLLAPHFAAGVVRRAMGLPDESPLVLAGPRHVLATCALAAGAGVRTGMTVRQAAYLCPEARVAPFDEATIHGAARRLLEALADFADAVEVEGLPQASARRRKPLAPALEARQAAAFYADLGRLRAGDATRLAEAMAATFARESGLYASVGLAPTLFAAFAAAHASAGAMLVVPPDASAAFLAPLPATLLPAEAEIARRLGVLGLTTLGALAALPPGAALAQFGKAGAVLSLLAQGIDHRRVSRFSRDRPLRATCQFESGVGARDMLESALRGVANRLAAHLRRRGILARAVGLTLHLEDGATLTRRATPREAVAGGPGVAEIVLRLFGQMKIGGPVAGFEIALDDLAPCAARQLPLLPDESAEADSLQAALEALAVRPRPPRCVRPVMARADARRIEQRYRYEAP